MRNLIYTALLLTLILAAPGAAVVHAQDSAPNPEEPFAGDVLCLPGAYLIEPEECLALGPSTLLTDLARKGVSYPFQPLPAVNPPEELNQVDINYAKINIPATERTKLFSSPDEAANGANPIGYLDAGRNIYLTYINRVDINGGAYLQMPSGEWVRGSPVASSMTSFQGLLFQENPSNSFGWIVEPTRPRAQPNYNAPETERALNREEVVQIFDRQNVNGTDWYMVGLNEWVDRRHIRQFNLNATRPEGVDRDRWIEVNLYEQTLAVYEDGRLAFATLVATGGDPFFTRPGLFQIYEKKPVERMSGAFEADKSDYYLFDGVPWTMYFDQARALHGAYWRANFGYPETHGCVNLSIGDANWLYRWAEVGDWVYVWDPSGQTPTDPELYTAGGA